MGKRCKSCKVPLEGFMFKWVASKLFGIRASSKDRELCNKCEGMIQTVQGKEIGKMVHYYGHIGVGIIELTDTLKVGDRIRVKGHTSDFKQDVASMQIEHADVAEGHRGNFIGIKVGDKVHVGDKVYKI